MTLTTPHCPAAETLPADVESRVSAVEGVASVKIEAHLGARVVAAAWNSWANHPAGKQAVRTVVSALIHWLKFPNPRLTEHTNLIKKGHCILNASPLSEFYQ